MDIHIHLKLTSPAWLRNVVAIGAVVGFAAVARGDVPNNNFMSGTPIKSAEVNANFKYLNDAITALQTAVPSRTIFTNAGGTPGHNSVSVGGGYCNVTSTPYDGATIGGYDGAKQKCELAPNCTSTAHMCSGEEMVRFAQTGGTFPLNSSGWIATGEFSGVSSDPVFDCQGFALNTATAYGDLWGRGPTDKATGAPSVMPCNMPFVIACCD